MARSTVFRSEQASLKQDPTLQLTKVQGPIKFLNPTQARFDHVYAGIPESKVKILPVEVQKSSDSSLQVVTSIPATEKHVKPELALLTDIVPIQKGVAVSGGSIVQFKWTSRNSRKNRHAIVVKPSSDDKNAAVIPPPFTDTTREVLRGTFRMFTTFPLSDVSWLTAFITAVASLVWLANSCFVFLPFARPARTFKDETL